MVVFVSPEKNFLRNILGLRVIAGEARGGREHHILVVAHESREISRRTYAGFGGVHWRSIVRRENPGGCRKVAGIYGHLARPTLAHKSVRLLRGRTVSRGSGIGRRGHRARTL